MGLLNFLGLGNTNPRKEDHVQKTAQEIGEALLTGDSMNAEKELGATGRLMALCAAGSAQCITNASFDNERAFDRGGMSM